MGGLPIPPFLSSRRDRMIYGFIGWVARTNSYLSVAITHHLDLTNIIAPGVIRGSITLVETIARRYNTPIVIVSRQSGQRPKKTFDYRNRRVNIMTEERQNQKKSTAKRHSYCPTICFIILTGLNALLSFLPSSDNSIKERFQAFFLTEIGPFSWVIVCRHRLSPEGAK